MKLQAQATPRAARKTLRQRGFTLIEIGIVVGIAALLVGIAMALVPQIMVQIRSNSEASEMPGIAGKIQKVYSNRAIFPATATMGPELGSLNAFPPERVTNAAAGTFNNRFGGAITPTQGTITNAGDALWLDYTNVPSAECIEVVQAVANGPRQIWVNGTGAGNLVKPAGGPVDLTVLPAQCNAATNVSIRYEFNK